MLGRRLIGLVILGLVVTSFFNSPRKSTHSHAHARAGEVIQGEVVSIADGDTLTVLDGADREHRIRLFGIDAPEKAQAFGRQSKENLAEKVFRKTVRVEVVDIDRYGREVGRIYLGRRFINEEMVEDGFAWRYTAYDHNREFEAPEADARRRRRGLWADPHPIPPWEFRREKRTDSSFDERSV